VKWRRTPLRFVRLVECLSAVRSPSTFPAHGAAPAHPDPTDPTTATESERITLGDPSPPSPSESGDTAPRSTTDKTNINGATEIPAAGRA
jgi:hypothetical protein